MPRLARAPIFCALTIFGLLTLDVSMARAQATLSAGELRVALDARGFVTELHNASTGRNYLAPDTVAPLLSVVSGAARARPTGLTSTRTRSALLLTLRYATLGATVVIRARSVGTHLSLDIVSATPERLIDAVIWGPYPTVVTRTVGEIIGVVRDGTIALGLQVLNMKTLGGDLPNREGSTWERGIAATRTASGSTLQAYAINRARVRTVDAWGGVYHDMPVPPIPGETVVGSSIALFTCAEGETLDRLARIEVAEQLPHPTMNGRWFRQSPEFERSYLISSFGEAEADEMLAYTRRAGLMSLYHEGPFLSWGHFVLNTSQFPNGRRGLKAVVDKARAAGLHVGVHTLTNFINTNDAYVTPVPDDRLSVTGTSPLVRGIDAQQRTLEVQSPTYFADQKTNYLHTVKIGHELIRYRAVSATAPYTLLDCQRGAFGTPASAHAAGDRVGKLFDHSYNVFFPNFDMQREVARNLSDFLNETGVDHLDLDGHEGALASGQGDYALAVFAHDVVTQTHHDLIIGTSISKTFYWHIGSYYNWGEPWNGGFTESMQQYRIDNQALFDRNYMPHMLGWYLLSDRTSMAEMEWMLARAAGYGAGFAMVARPQALRANPRTPALLDAIREWEEARTTHAFDSAQQARLKDPRNEFHLTRTDDRAWELAQYLASPVFVRERAERQPGEPTSSVYAFDQPWDEQRLQFRLRVVGGRGTARNVTLRIDGAADVEIPMALNAGESMGCDGTAIVRVYDAGGKARASLTLPDLPPLLARGLHSIVLDSGFDGDSPPRLELQLRGLGQAEPVRARR